MLAEQDCEWLVWVWVMIGLRLTKHFFKCCGIDIRVKHRICTAGPLNAELWGYEAWNISDFFLERSLLETYLLWKPFMARRTARYISKVTNSTEVTL
jgi:hypothetical protein